MQFKVQDRLTCTVSLQGSGSRNDVFRYD